ncbi:MAG: tRNA (guanosine(37)-N1)-methyltransferase TrmD [Myxococcales bacterium FL481]|nr:MAG: tRNA (guanosine(37)-N1)-methyltransferase TrmD [Myxococcales bacterium FL481]
MTTPLEFEVFTLFPAAVQSFASSGILGRAARDGRVAVHTTDFRQFTDDRHGRVDDAPFGGGPGMTIRVQPVAAALAHVSQQRGAMHRVLLTPSAPRFDQPTARRLAAHDRIGLLCGRYEGIDDRVREHFVDECLSIGDYVLNGGEVAAAVIIEAVARLREGVLGNAASVEHESYDASNRLEHPQYTRPEAFEGWRVPAVLLTGDHAAIHRWRRSAAVRRTFELRPDLLPPLSPHVSYVVLPRGASAASARAFHRVSGLWQPQGDRLRAHARAGARAQPDSRDLRDLRRRVRARHGEDPVWVRVRLAGDAAHADEATSIEMCLTMVDANGGAGAPIVWVLDDDNGAPGRPPHGFAAVLRPRAGPRGPGLADPPGIEHPSPPIAGIPAPAASIEAFASELAATPAATSDSLP